LQQYWKKTVRIRLFTATDRRYYTGPRRTTTLTLTLALIPNLNINPNPIP